MRLLHVLPSYLPATRYGGPIYSVHGLCAALVAAGHDVHVYTTNVDGARESDVPIGTPVQRDGVIVHYFRSPALRRLYWSPPMREALHAEIAGFDLAHLHSVFLWPTSMAARAAAAAGVPYVVSPRGMLVPELIDAKSKRVKNAWLTFVESRTLADAAAAHFTSEHELGAARRLALPLPSPFVVPNGVDLLDPSAVEAGSGEATRLTGGEPYALFLGRMVPKKGLDVLVDAIAGTAIRVLAFGPDDEGYGATVTASARAAGAALEVRAAVDGEAKAALLANARLLVLPSRDENFGNAVVEAMSAGCPVVTTTGVGAGELVRQANAGVVCACEPSALREALVMLWERDDLRTRMGDDGRDFVQQNLTWPRIAERMADVYERLRG